jgi:putative hydrolase of the HAD superfamily
MIARMPPRAILLDALGTLVALVPPAPLLAALVHERHGIEVPRDAVLRAMRSEMAHYRAHCISAADRPSLDALRLECAAIVANELGLELDPAALLPTLLESLRFTAFPEVAGTLARWREAGMALVVASNWDVSLHDVLAATGLRERLDGVVTSAETGAAKPSPALFAAALEVAGASPADAVHIGDSVAQDVAGARAAGIAALLLRRDGAPAPDAPPAGVRVIASLDEYDPLAS